MAGGITDTGPIDLGAIRARDPRLDRTKIVYVDLGFLMSLLSLDGTQLLEMEGLPKDKKAEVVSWMIQPAVTLEGRPIQRLAILVYHPSFAVMPANAEVRQLVINVKTETREHIVAEAKKEAADGATDDQA